MSSTEQEQETSLSSTRLKRPTSYFPNQRLGNRHFYINFPFFKFHISCISSDYYPPVIIICLVTSVYAALRYFLYGQVEMTFYRLLLWKSFSIGCLLFTIDLFYVCFCNPGYWIFHKDFPKEIELDFSKESLRGGGESEGMITGGDDESGREMQQKETGYVYFCGECRVTERAKKMYNVVHCRDCGMCVYGYDHHCGVLGTCIGKRNLICFYFILFLFFLIFFGGYGILIDFMTEGFGYDDDRKRERLRHGMRDPRGYY